MVEPLYLEPVSESSPASQAASSGVRIWNSVFLSAQTSKSHIPPGLGPSGHAVQMSDKPSHLDAAGFVAVKQEGDIIERQKSQIFNLA